MGKKEEIVKQADKKETKKELVERFKKTTAEELFTVQEVKKNIPDVEKYFKLCYLIRTLYIF